MTTQQINTAIYEIWSNYGKYHNGLAPEFVKGIKKDGLLFVGLNPAFNIKRIAQDLRANNHSETDPKKFFAWNELEEKDSFIDRVIDIETVVKSELYPYFKKFDLIAKNLDEEWSHIDLFYYRETDQSKLKPIIFSKNALNEFGKVQLKVSADLIRLSNPKVIIFANALASNIFQINFKDFGFDSLEFDDTQGFHLLDVNDKKIPTFFSGMLTGQRALDLGSFQRLEWHIGKALQQSS